MTTQEGNYAICHCRAQKYELGFSPETLTRVRDTRRRPQEGCNTHMHQHHRRQSAELSLGASHVPHEVRISLTQPVGRTVIAARGIRSRPGFPHRQTHNNTRIIRHTSNRYPHSQEECHTASTLLPMEPTTISPFEVAVPASITRPFHAKQAPCLKRHMAGTVMQYLYN